MNDTAAIPLNDETRRRLPGPPAGSPTARLEQATTAVNKLLRQPFGL
jgi:hypothetical protein